MKGAYLVSLDSGFFGEIVAALAGEGAEYSSGDDPMVQLTDGDGRVFTVFGAVEDRYFLEDWAGPLRPAEDRVVIPDLRMVAVCSVECRWEGLFVETVGRLARRVSQPMWVLDGMDVVWSADAIDVTRLSL